ncbi:protein of unknown function [Bradyrhizobium vignae]|uniref:Uncharacterized protein n=1 Tax=Bradyrhizobium vignae TaxID=1549949 RepID=A0A2U3PVN3_9BRAD|nr:protein of unknown function [Bradyrhizobium vignae]
MRPSKLGAGESQIIDYWWLGRRASFCGQGDVDNCRGWYRK